MWQNTMEREQNAERRLQSWSGAVVELGMSIEQIFCRSHALTTGLLSCHCSEAAVMGRQPSSQLKFSLGKLPCE